MLLPAAGITFKDESQKFLEKLEEQNAFLFVFCRFCSVTLDYIYVILCKLVLCFYSSLLYSFDPMIFNEPEHDKTTNMTCAPSKGSEQPGRLPSLISLLCTYWVA